jgi:GT2 family glycosyltransferase
MREKLKVGLRLLKDMGNYFYWGWKSSLLKPYLKNFAKLSKEHLFSFHSTHLLRFNKISIQDKAWTRMQNTARGLYSLLPQDKRFSYSILLPVNNSSLPWLERSLLSIIQQTPPSLEILIGYQETPLAEMKQLIEKLNYPFKEIYLIDALNYILAINQLASHATGNFLFIMDPQDWIRPDLIFRFEQTLRLLDDPMNTVTYCYENKISDKGYFIPGSELKKPNQLYFPFFFDYFSEKGMLIPKQLWQKAGGLRLQRAGAEYEDLILRLDALGAHFQHIPVFLYSHRSTSLKNQQVLLKALEDYSATKGLNWQWSIVLDSIRVQPPLPKHSVQVIIPFKDQKEMTLKCIQKVLIQKDVSCHITAIDNRSQDPSIAKEIQALGGEVLFIDEPFNYSRLNNLAVKNTSSNCDILLFLNNDVELESDAIAEMLRWIDQPNIGMVGCRLHYPNGKIQHGGVKLNPKSLQLEPEMRWEHIDCLYPLEKAQQAKKILITEAVTAACALVKKEVFLEVGGFDEVWYPIGFSDTNLALKIRNKGLLCLYTPFASGIHHESISRKTSIEDFESTWWLHHLVEKRNVEKINL